MIPTCAIVPQTPEACADIAPLANTCDPVEEIPSADALRELDAVIMAQCKIEEPERRFTGQLSGWVVYLTRRWIDLYDRWKALPPLPPGEACPPYVWFTTTTGDTSILRSDVELAHPIDLKALLCRPDDDAWESFLCEGPTRPGFRGAVVAPIPVAFRTEVIISDFCPITTKA